MLSCRSALRPSVLTILERWTRADPQTGRGYRAAMSESAGSAWRRASARSRAPRSSSSGRRTRTHGDFATNVAMRSREVDRAARRGSSRRSSPRRSSELDEIESAEVAGPGFLNLRLADAFFLEALAEIDEGYGGGWAEQPERVQVEMVSANPTGPIVVSAARNGAYGDCVARLLEFGGHTVSREYYYNDAGAQMDRFRASVDALRRGEPVPEDGYQGDYVAALAAERRRPGAADARVDRGDDGALPHPLRQLGAAERARAAAARVPAAPRHLREGRRALGALVCVRRRAGLGDRSARPRRAARRPTAPPTSSTSSTSSSAATTARSTCSAPTTTRRRTGTPRSRACSATTRSRVEVLLYQFVHLTRGGEASKASKRAGNVVFLDELHRRDRRRRGALVPRQPRARTRRSRSTSTSRPRSRRRTRSTTCSTRTRGSRRSCGTPTARRSAAPPPGPLATEEKRADQAADRLPGDGARGRRAARPAAAAGVCDPARRRLPPLLPRVPRARRPGAVVPARLCRATQQVIARCLDLRRGRGAGPDVVRRPAAARVDPPHDLLDVRLGDLQVDAAASRRRRGRSARRPAPRKRSHWRGPSTRSTPAPSS